MTYDLGFGITRDFINTIDLALRRGDYDTAVILGKGLAYLLEAERGSYWGYYSYALGGRLMPIHTVGLRVLEHMLPIVKEKIERDLEDDLMDIEKVLKGVSS